MSTTAGMPGATVSDISVRRGTRPSVPKDQRTKSVYIFNAICPEHGKGAIKIIPQADR